jgi:hypothetical protein
LDEAQLAAALGSDIQSPPDPATFAHVLCGYYEELEVGALRLRSDRLVMQRPGHDPSVRSFVAKIMLAAPELGWLAIEDGARGPRLRAQGHSVDLLGIETDALRMPEGIYERRTVSPRIVVAAANVLLAALDEPRRLLPLHVPEAFELYLMVDEEEAELLASVGVLAAPLERLVLFAGWERAAQRTQASA